METRALAKNVPIREYHEASTQTSVRSKRVTSLKPLATAISVYIVELINDPRQ